MGRRSRARRARGIAPASPTPPAAPRPAPLSDERPEGAVAPVPARRAVRARRDRADRARADRRLRLRPRPARARVRRAARVARRARHRGARALQRLPLALERARGLPGVVAAAALFFARAPWIAVAVAPRSSSASPSGPSAPRSAAARAGCRSAEHSLPTVSDEERRMRLRGLHHVTAICRDLEATIAFYRDVMGLAIVRDGAQRRRPGLAPRVVRRARRRAGALVSFMEYPQLPKGVTGVGSTHHFALVVESAEELEAWRDYLRGQGRGVHRPLRPRRVPLALPARPRRPRASSSPPGPGFGAGPRG